MSDIRDLPMTMLDGADTTFGDAVGDRAALVVNGRRVGAGLTPQYSDLEALHEELAERDSRSWAFLQASSGPGARNGRGDRGVLLDDTTGSRSRCRARSRVNGPGRHPVYQALTEVADERGYSGDIRWNFEKFLISPDGRITARFHHKTLPSATHVREAIEAVPGDTGRWLVAPLVILDLMSLCGIRSRSRGAGRRPGWSGVHALDREPLDGLQVPARRRDDR